MALELWQKNLIRLLRENERAHGLNRVSVALAAGVSPALITKYTKDGFNNPTPKYLSRIAEVLGVTLEQMYEREQEDTSMEEDGQVRRITFNRDLRLIEEWVATQGDPDYIAKTIRFLVESNYEDFRQWQKKRSTEKQGKKVAG